MGPALQRACRRSGLPLLCDVALSSLSAGAEHEGLTLSSSICAILAVSRFIVASVRSISEVCSATAAGLLKAVLSCSRSTQPAAQCIM